MTEEKLPRDVPYDPEVPPKMQEDYIRAIVAAEATGVTRKTILNHLKRGTLMGMRMSARLWYVQRITKDSDPVPALDMWTTAQVGNPNWIKKDQENT